MFRNTYPHFWSFPSFSLSFFLILSHSFSFSLSLTFFLSLSLLSFLYLSLLFLSHSPFLCLYNIILHVSFPLSPFLSSFLYRYVTPFNIFNIFLSLLHNTQR
uniref:Uncharacterized protein n=1 Tax=Cacopsylla melanoneura TaxID=428564 RepID=A0A8D8VTK0_9HEMI